MSDPTGGAPQDPAAPPPTPGSGAAWGTPAPAQAPGGFQAAAIEAGPAPGVAYADLTTRIIAYIIDGILYGIIFFIVFSIVGLILLGALLTGGAILALIGVVILAAVSLVGSAVYFVYTWTTMRASPGQRILGLETVRAADGATLTRDQAIKRWAYLFGPSALSLPLQLGLAGTGLDGLGSLVNLLVFLYSIYLLYSTSQSSKRQGFHDVQAGTVVVKRSR